MARNHQMEDQIISYSSTCFFPAQTCSSFRLLQCAAFLLVKTGDSEGQIQECSILEWNLILDPTMSGVQSSLSAEVLPPSRRDRSSSPVHTPKVSLCSLHVVQRKIKCSPESTTSPHSQRFVSTALMLCKYLSSGVISVQSCARKLACLLCYELAPHMIEDYTRWLIMSHHRHMMAHDESLRGRHSLTR
jgi:hypothetical protein